ncbi:unnamed protein product [Polarella glacialis]|uniref:Uncharacterized protein n=1 Tax=Polarella glacialis TaxID=89957 RepID=A0A813IRF9_POLGL|nr:unnamed protein product [Polarella glacialis]
MPAFPGTPSRWLESGIRAASNSIGIAAAYYVEARLFALSNARIGARMIVQGASRFSASQKHISQMPDGGAKMMTVAENLLCVAGIYMQFIRGRGSMASVMLRFLWGSWSCSTGWRILLGIPLLAEAWLQASVAATRAGLLD